MSTDYDPVRRLAQLGLGVLAASVRDGTEVTIHLKAMARTAFTAPSSVINVDERGKILLGDPMAYQLQLDPASVRVSSVVSQLPLDRSIAWEKQRENL
jgi:hypothetical protein